MLPARFAPLVFAAILSCMMTAVMSGAITALNLGINRAALMAWLVNFPKIWLLAFVSIFLLRPLAQKITQLLVAAEKT